MYDMHSLSYNRPPLEAASKTGLRPLKKYPQLRWGMLIECFFILVTYSAALVL